MLGPLFYSGACNSAHSITNGDEATSWHMTYFYPATLFVAVYLSASYQCSLQTWYPKDSTFLPAARAQRLAYLQPNTLMAEHARNCNLPRAIPQLQFTDSVVFQFQLPAGQPYHKHGSPVKRDIPQTQLL